MTDTPKNKQELLDVFGFGNVKVEKYGDMIIEIINREQRGKHMVQKEYTLANGIKIPAIGFGTSHFVIDGRKIGKECSANKLAIFVTKEYYSLGKGIWNGENEEKLKYF